VGKGGGVAVVAELTEQGDIAPISLELLGIGAKLADELDGELSAMVLGCGLPDVAQDLISHGAGRVYIASESPSQDDPDACLELLEAFRARAEPDVVLLGHTTLGQDLAPRLAFRADTGVVTDCVDLNIDPETGLLRCAKPIYGGVAIGVYVVQTKPQVATVRVRVGKPVASDDRREGEVIRVDIDADSRSSRYSWIEKVKEVTPGPRLEDASVVVTGGRGIGGPEGFEQLRDLAKLLGGALGATRPPCDSGWVLSSCQVGLTGKIVSPNLYIAVGVSGATQHLTGMSESKHIIAINKDPDAGIFKVADFGVVGDYREVVPAFVRKLDDLLS
jgi:electron transfer flavoprotein alpha subunit